MVITDHPLHPLNLWSLRMKHFGYTSELGSSEFAELEDVSLRTPPFQIVFCSLRN